jgi:hypothetical protein
MTHQVFRASLAGLLALTTLAGCTRWIDVMPSSASRQELAARAIEEQDRVPLVMESFRLVTNGSPQNPSAAVERRVLNHVQETRLFSTLVPLGNAPGTSGKAVTARLVIEETVDPHSGETAFKGFVIGASMFLLSPAIELAYDYAAQATLELERWDGEVKRYAARSAGTARYNLFGATPIMIDELKGQVTEACLAQLIDQLVTDTTFYVASSAPLPDGLLRTVTVKARKPAAGPAVLPVSAPAP